MWIKSSAGNMTKQADNLGEKYVNMQTRLNIDQQEISLNKTAFEAKDGENKRECKTAPGGTFSGKDYLQQVFLSLIQSACAI